MLKRALAVIFLASITGLALLTFLAASAISAPDPGLSRSNQTINRLTKPDPQLPALPGEGRVEIRGYETGRAPTAPLGSALGDSANTQAGPDTFYGNETLYPLIDSGTMIIPLPGGARVEIRDGETTYVLTDHLGSARVALGADNTVSGRIEYTPFGESRETGGADVVRSYTGKVFEPETGTYDFHARRYDPSSGRFTSVDAARKSISPYSYASNNPVNTVDPDGLGPVYFWMYSMYGVDVEDKPGVRSMRSHERRREIANVRSDVMTVATATLEGRDSLPVYLGKDDEVHLTLSQHGTAGLVVIWDPKTHTREWMDGREFTHYLYERLESKSKGSSGKLKSILFEACFSCAPGLPPGASNQSGKSFADEFVVTAKDIFPNLEHVFASPYKIAISTDPSDERLLTITLNESDNHGTKRFLSTRVEGSEFYTGNLPPKLLDAPKLSNVVSVGEEEPVGPSTEYLDRPSIEAFWAKPGFTEPFFYKIPVPPPTD